MLRVVFALVWALVLLGLHPASASELRREAAASQNLGRNMPYLVYLPDGYDVGEWQYPVIYLLHGAGGDENAWVERGALKEQADRLIADGAIPPSLIVMPGCPGCWWVDGARDKAETAFWNDLVPAVQKRFRTIETRDGRLIAGLSAGGYGAVRFALRYPDRIAAAAALSPAIYSGSPPAESSARTQPPFLDASGRFSQSAWDALNYPHLIAKYFAGSQRVPLYLASGDQDRLGIAFETALLFKNMFEHQPDQVALRVVAGDHSWAVWADAIDDALTYIGRYAASPQVAPKTPSGPAVVAKRDAPRPAFPF